ncbi:flagellar hook-length control protein FliK [Desulfosoma sp.]|uniref:flagellar hook-length control protein FliK n=1 Tax=Desulfosoma sp. TaxID=2603217 RepID=UPI0040497D67
MKGLSVGRAELVSRFVAKERQRISRSLESSTFASALQQQSQLLGGPFSKGQQGPVASAQAPRLFLSLDRVPSSGFKKRLGGETAEKPHLEVADPLLVQEILSLFYAPADQTKKAATLTGDEGALALEELIAMLERSSNEHPADSGQEQVSAEDFRKLLRAIRWSDTKHKAVPNVDGFAWTLADDRQDLAATLKNLLASAEAQQASLEKAKSGAAASSPPSDNGDVPDRMGPPGVADAIKDDFMMDSESTPFRLWHTSSDQETRRPVDRENPRGAKLNDDRKTRGTGMTASLDSCALESQELQDLQTSKNETGIVASVQPPATEETTGMASMPAQALAPQVGSSPQGFTQPWSPVFHLTDQSQPNAAQPPETLAAEIEPFLWNRPAPQDLPAEKPGLLEELGGLPETPSAPQVNAMVSRHLLSMDVGGELVEDSSQVSDSLPLEVVRDLFEIKGALAGEDFNGAHSSGENATPFGDPSPPFHEGDFRPLFQDSFGGPILSPFSPASTTPNKALETRTILSLEQPEWPQELGHRLSLLSRGGKNSMTLELQPESLGKLLVRVETHGTHVSALVQTEHPVVREILQSNTASLRDILADHGLQLMQFSVDVRHSNTPFSREDDALLLPNVQPAPVAASLNEKPEETMPTLHVMDGNPAALLSVRV